MSARRRNGREIRQKGKDRKRGRTWHRKAELVELVAVGSGAAPTGAPVALRRNGSGGVK